MPFLNGFEASIVVETVEVLPTYGVVIDESQRTLTCWIPSEANRRYKVVWRCQNDLVKSRGDVYIDGKGVGSELICRQSELMAEKEKSTLGSCLFFAFPEQSDINEQSMDTPTPDTPQTASQYGGEIRLIIHRINMFKKKARNIDLDIPEDIERIATFIFKYRTIDFLSVNGIQNQETMILPAIHPNEIIEHNVPSTSGISLNQPNSGDIRMQDNNEAINSQIHELEGRLNKLYVRRANKEKARFNNLIRSKGYLKDGERLLKGVRTTIQRQKIEDEIRNLPKRLKSRRIRKRLATGDSAVQPAEVELLELGPDEHF